MVHAFVGYVVSAAAAAIVVVVAVVVAVVVGAEEEVLELDALVEGTSSSRAIQLENQRMDLELPGRCSVSTSTVELVVATVFPPSVGAASTEKLTLRDRSYYSVTMHVVVGWTVLEAVVVLDVEECSGEAMIVG